jgi:hypothetical protein
VIDSGYWLLATDYRLTKGCRMVFIYLFRCGCGRTAEVARDVERRNDSEPCACGGKMRRTFTAPHFTANRSCDLVENRIYRGDRDDVKRQQKSDDEKYERMTANWDLTRPKTKTMDDILSSGIVQAARSGPEAIQQWRSDNIPSDSEPVNT